MQGPTESQSAPTWGKRPKAFAGIGLAVSVAAMIALASLAGVGLRTDAPAESTAGTPAPISPALAPGAPVSLGFLSETGGAIGGVLDPTVSVPIHQADTIVVTLPLQNLGKLQAFLESVSNPESSSYAEFLTSQQFTAAYSPPATEQQAIANYLASDGATIDYLTPDHVSITATATLQQLETAFGVTFAMYAKGTQVFFAPTSSPSFPSNLAPWVYGVAGLTDYSFGIHTDVLRSLGGTGSASVAPGSGVLDYPNQMLYEYQLNQLFNATGNRTAGVVPTYDQGVVIAPALWDSGIPGDCAYSLADVKGFFNGTTGTAENFPSDLLPPTDHANYNITGDPGVAPGGAFCDTFGVSPNLASEELSFELTIDQEYSGENAPGATIEPTYVNGTGITVLNSDTEILMAWIAAGNIPNLAVVSQSFGGGESANSSGSYEAVSEQDYEEMAAQGVTVLASSGDDNGAEGAAGDAPALCGSGPASEGVPVVDYPGSSPNVLSVGGTANMASGTPSDPTGGLAGQTVWNWCPNTDSGESAGSTGGVSSAFPEAWYQSADPIVNRAMMNAINVTESGNGSANSPGGINDGTVYSSTSARPDPDLSGPAANMTGYFGQEWLSGWGGTSFSSPSVAGMLGSIIAFDGHKLGLFGPALYTLEQEWLNGQIPLAPTYYVQNYSNAFFDGATDYNTSAGWGVPQAYNIALLLGKPFLSTNPTGAGAVGVPYPITANVVDDRNVKTVDVAYLAPGARTWANASLSLASGTAQHGTWSGSIPASVGAGTLEYCVYAVDQGAGNSWTPYNQSAWAATHGANVNFGCTVPWTIPVHQTYSGTFTESGLAAGTPWTVSVGGSSQTTTATTVTFLLENGTHTYSVGVAPGYNPPSPASGTIVTAGASTSVSVSFGRLYFTLEFTESGLPTGTTWQLSVNGGAAVSSNGNTISFQEPNGTYAYDISGIAGWHITSGSYAGSATLAGASETVATQWSAVTYDVTFSEQGLASGGKWTVVMDGITTSSTASSILFVVGNGTYTYTASASGHTSVSGSLTVKGATATVSISFKASGKGAPDLGDLVLSNATGSPGSALVAAPRPTARIRGGPA
jgi:Pro-kumamolisin, activation domain